MPRRTNPALPFHILLLLVALFNALVGVPLHEARHIQQLAGIATASAAAVDVDAVAVATDSPASDEHSENTHTTCSWCLTHALEAGFAYAPGNQPPLPAQLSAALPQGAADPFTAQQVRWPFSVRDPPVASRA